MLKIEGDWYLQVGSDDLAKPDSKCIQFNFEQKNEFLVMGNVSLAEDKVLSINLGYDPIRQTLRSYERVIVSPVLFIDVPIEYQAIYVNDKYLLLYGCGNYLVYSSMESVEAFYLLKKDRSLNNFDEIYKILSMLKLVKADLNRANLVVNDSTCNK